MSRHHLIGEDAGGYYCTSCGEREPHPSDACPGRPVDRSDLNLHVLVDVYREILTKFQNNASRWPFHWNKLTILNEYVKLCGITRKHPFEELQVSEAIGYVLLYHKHRSTKLDIGAHAREVEHIRSQLEATYASLNDLTRDAVDAYLTGENAGA